MTPLTALWRWIICPALLGSLEGGIVWLFLHNLQANPTRAAIIGIGVALFDFVGMALIVLFHDLDTFEQEAGSQ